MKELNSPEVLTRQQLKNVLGGSGAITTKACSSICWNKDGKAIGSIQVSNCGTGHAVCSYEGTTKTTCVCA